MPFTFAHPSAVLPLKSKYFNLSGLILGSMAPDMIYFLLFSPSSNVGHTFLGCILFNLPMCLILNDLFYKYIQETLIVTLPHFIASKYWYVTKNKNILSNKNDVLKFLYSCLIGMSTHIIWDAFTHRTGFFVKNISLLSNSMSLSTIEIPFYKMLQHGSTLVGFVIIVLYIYKNRDTTNKTYCIKINKRKICLSIIASTTIMMIVFMGIFLKTKGFMGIGRIIITFINSIFLSYLMIGIIVYNKIRNNTSYRGNKKWYDK